MEFFIDFSTKVEQKIYIFIDATVTTPKAIPVVLLMKSPLMFDRVSTRKKLVLLNYCSHMQHLGIFDNQNKSISYKQL